MNFSFGSHGLPQVFWRIMIALAILTGGDQASAARPESGRDPVMSSAARKKSYAPCDSCGNCHQKIYEEHLGSMHSRSFSNPVFLAQYTREILPQARSSAAGFREARSCTSCHAPVAHQRSRARLVDPAATPDVNASVTCDFCHRIDGFTGAEPGNGNYRATPGPAKFGPFRTASDWHHQYNQIQTRSEFCAICHSVRNDLGLDIKSTYAEWKESRHAKEGIQCQDCHMSVNGFLTEGKAVHASGQAAVMSLGGAPSRKVLYTHGFQGARSRSQIEGAIQLAFGTQMAPAAPGGRPRLELLVDNSRTGHKMPSGSVELRYLWLEVYAVAGGQRIDLTPSANPECKGYDVTGLQAETDDAILAGAVPANRRIYRTILTDAHGRSTLAFYDAKNIAFDNRLEASEVRREVFELPLPDDAEPAIQLTATMYYVAYPDSFAERLGLPKAEPVKIASTETRMLVKR